MKDSKCEIKTRIRIIIGENSNRGIVVLKNLRMNEGFIADYKKKQTAYLEPGIEVLMLTKKVLP